jgi:hypothetical protein
MSYTKPGYDRLSQDRPNSSRLCKASVGSARLGQAWAGWGRLSSVRVGYVHFAQYVKKPSIFKGLMIALAIEECNLHRRVALKALRFVGTSPRWIIHEQML